MVEQTMHKHLFSDATSLMQDAEVHALVEHSSG
jgi:hypothetical protein